MDKQIQNQKEQEKYLIINNAYQFHIIIKCTYKTLNDYIEYGKTGTIKADGSIDLLGLSEWLTKRNVRHRAEVASVKNPILKFLIRKDVRKVNHSAIDHDLFISDDEMEVLMTNLENGGSDMCWNFCDI
jgi:hypothetical protein